MKSNPIKLLVTFTLCNVTFSEVSYSKFSLYFVKNITSFFICFLTNSALMVKDFFNPLRFHTKFSTPSILPNHYFKTELLQIPAYTWQKFRITNYRVTAYIVSVKSPKINHPINKMFVHFSK